MCVLCLNKGAKYTGTVVDELAWRIVHGFSIACHSYTLVDSTIKGVKFKV